MSVCKTSFTLTVHLGLEAILVNYTNVTVIAVFELHILLIVLWMCGTLFRQIVLTFHLLLHLNGRFSRLTCRRFYSTQWTAQGPVFGAVCDSFCLCMKYLRNRWTDLRQIHTEDVFGPLGQVWGQGEFRRPACGLCLEKHLRSSYCVIRLVFSLDYC